MENYDIKMSRVLRNCQELSIILGKGFKISVNPKYLLLACKEIEIRFAALIPLPQCKALCHFEALALRNLLF